MTFVHVANDRSGVMANDSGHFSMSIPANKNITLLFEYVGYKTEQQTFFLKANKEKNISVYLTSAEKELNEVQVTADAARKDIGTIQISADKAILNPSPVGGIEGLIKTYVGSNNELTSNYSVRGGNYDENLVYVNDYEIYRPFLISAAQQEGLSFINPFMVKNVKFFNGGFQAKYGDRMSSVLDVEYKRPQTSGGAAYISPLEQGLQLEGTGKKQKFTYLLGLRNRNNRNILQSQETTGNYIPASSDIQAFLSWHISQKWSLEFLGNYSDTKFTFFPQNRNLSANVLSPFYDENYSMHMQLEGSERDRYNTAFSGISAIQKVNKNLTLKWMFHYFRDNERENIDIKTQYAFGKPDRTSDEYTFDTVSAGMFHQFARNRLQINLWAAQHRGYLTTKNHFIQWGISAEKQFIDDKINRWTYTDSLGYALPYSADKLLLNDVQLGAARLNVLRFSGFIQNNIRLRNNFILNIGARINYNDLNKELVISPRAGLSYQPNARRNIVLRASAGKYVQPAFYREMRSYEGTINTQIKAQKSWQSSLGVDYNFKMFSRPARWSTEAFYKYMYDVNPYDIDNVRVRYHGHNNAVAYAAGVETRLFGELVKDAESWISISLMQTKEKINGLSYTDYLNASGEVIYSGTADQNIADSIVREVGWVRRPTDRLLTFGMFFQDYLSFNKNFKVYLNTIYGTNMPYNIPGSTRYRNALIIPSYLRVDVGFSALLLSPEKIRRSYSPFRNFKNIWATLEVFNLINKSNTISYQLVKDYNNTVFAMPNRLTPRLLNFKIVATW